MTTSLLQAVDTSPPELPGATTLQIDTSGQPGVLLHDLGSDHDSLYCRVIVHAAEASGGELAIMGGARAGGRSLWQVVIDTNSPLVRLEVGAAQLTAGLPNAIAWHCVEVSLDAITGGAALRVNGIGRGTLSIALAPTRQAWIGGAFFDPGLTGTVRLDQWVLSTQPIGVPVAVPLEDHGADARRWLVVYHRDDAESCAWAETYRARRGVPFTNLCGLSLPTTEAISAAEFETMRQQINDYLDENGLRQQVVGVLLGLNVPGYADVADQSNLTPIASYLHTDDSHGLPVVNPLYQSEITTRPAASDYIGVRLTGRIDAPNLAEAIALMDRADVLLSQPLSHDGGSDLLVDINPDNPNVGPVYTQPVADWAAGNGLSSLRLPTTVYDAQAPDEAGNEAVVWGWRDAAPSPGYFSSLAGRRAICMQFDPEPVPSVSARDADATDWMGSALQAGYAFAAAPSRAYSLSSLPLPHLFFEGLQRGWAVAEAWLVAQPFVRDGLQIVGDPLMPIAFPQSCYEVYGPAPRLDLIDFESPLAVLHEGQRHVALQDGDLPAPGEASRYLVCCLDSSGRSDHASAAAFAAIEADEPVRPALPAYPANEGWRVLSRRGQLLFTAYWPESICGAGVEAVQLIVSFDGEDPVVLNEITPDTGQQYMLVSTPLPDQPTRYRFGVVQGPATFNTPWSSEFQPATAPNQTLTVLEAS